MTIQNNIGNWGGKARNSTLFCKKVISTDVKAWLILESTYMAMYMVANKNIIIKIYGYSETIDVFSVCILLVSTPFEFGITALPGVELSR